MNAAGETGAASRRVAVLVEPRMLADMVSMLLVERGMEVVTVDDDLVDVVVVSSGRAGDVRTTGASATVVLDDDNGMPSTASPVVDLTQLFDAVEGRKPT